MSCDAVMTKPPLMTYFEATPDRDVGINPGSSASGANSGLIILKTNIMSQRL
jgi:hypothetical protein